MNVNTAWRFARDIKYQRLEKFDTSAVKLPGMEKQNNLPPECGQPIDVGEHVHLLNMSNHQVFNNKTIFAICGDQAK
jgi:urease beta subunit